MASTSTVTLFAVFITVSLLPPFTSSDNFLAPLLSPLMGDICKTVGCGKGTCKISENNDIDFPSYECECDPGWKQLFPSNSNGSAFKFLPCVIPNCTIDFSCSEAAPPQSKETTPNISIFEPCHWSNCGGGICNKTSGLAYTCECKEGYYNLFNNTAFPCFQECSIGGDCPNLGIAITNKSTASPPNLPDKSTNQARSLQHEFLYAMIMLVIASAAIL